MFIGFSNVVPASKYNISLCISNACLIITGFQENNPLTYLFLSV